MSRRSTHWDTQVLDTLAPDYFRPPGLPNNPVTRVIAYYPPTDFVGAFERQAVGMPWVRTRIRREEIPVFPGEHELVDKVFALMNEIEGFHWQESQVGLSAEKSAAMIKAEQELDALLPRFPKRFQNAWEE